MTQPPSFEIVQAVHSAYDWWKDIYLPALGIIATLFVGVVAVVVAVTGDRRRERREDRAARAAFAAEVKAHVTAEMGESRGFGAVQGPTIQQLYTLATRSGIQEAEWIAYFAHGGMYEYRERAKAGADYRTELAPIAEAVLIPLEDWPKHPARALRAMRERQKVHDAWTRERAAKYWAAKSDGESHAEDAGLAQTDPPT